MGYKLIASDIDGTLFNSNKNLSERTLKAIHRVLDSGGLFVVSSGRALHFCRLFEELTGLTDIPFILYNGAKVVNGPDHEVMFRQELSPGDALWLIEDGMRLKTTVVVWAGDKLYVNELNERTKAYKKLALTDPVVFRDPEKVIGDGVSKVLWFDEADRISLLKDALEASPHRSHINYFTSDPRFMEIVDKSCSKALALEKLCAHYQIRREDTISVGDGYNDLPMIEWAGLGVAMANADEYVRSRADAVTLSNDEDGVAALIERYFS